MGSDRAAAGGPAALEWSVKPWRGRGAAVLFLGVLFLGVFGAIGLWQRSLVWGMGVLLAGFYVLWPLLLTMSYRLDPEGATRSSRFARTRRYPWRKFSEYRVGGDGRTIVLRFADSPARLLQGGLTLFFPDAALLAQARSRLDAWLPPGEGRS